MSFKMLAALVCLTFGVSLCIAACSAKSMEGTAAAKNPASSWASPELKSLYSGATVYRHADEFGNMVYWTDRGGVFVVPAVEVKK